MKIVNLCIFGVLGGIFGGMGMGGGTLLIPLLSIFLGMEQRLCQGINLVSFLIVSIFSLIIHSKNKLIEFSVIWQLVVGGIMFAIIGSFAAKMIPTNILRTLFGGFLIVLGSFRFFKECLTKRSVGSTEIKK